jgi:hypothetical protein
VDNVIFGSQSPRIGRGLGACAASQPIEHDRGNLPRQLIAFDVSRHNPATAVASRITHRAIRVTN